MTGILSLRRGEAFYHRRGILSRPKNFWVGVGIQSEGQYGYEVERRGKFLRLLGGRRCKDQDV